MPKFSKQHYELVARILRTRLAEYEYELKLKDDMGDSYADAVYRITIKGIATDFHNVFRLDNDRYDADRYFAACGIDDWQDITEPTDHDVGPYETPDFYGANG